MKNNKTLKIMLDILMVILFFFLMKINITGLDFHEILGIVILIPLILHLFLNKNWIKSTIKNIHKLTNKGRIMSIINLSSIILIFIIIISGILISKSLFPNISVPNRGMIVTIHKFCSLLTVFLLLSHLVIHLPYILNYFKHFKKNIINNQKTVILFFSTLIVCSFIFVSLKSLLNDTTNKNESKKNPDVSSSIIENVPDSPSLNDYLNTLRCTGCNKHCLLTNPQCNTGRIQAEEATNEFNLSQIN